MNLSYCLCGDLLEVGSLAKGSRMLGWLGQLPDGQETSVGWERAGMGGGFINGICSVYLLDGCGLVLGRSGAEKIVGCGVWKEKCVQGQSWNGLVAIRWIWNSQYSRTW